jgi:alcohol dehydrogenase
LSANSRWEFHNPTRILFGTGSLREIARQAHGRTLLLSSAGATRRGLTERAASEIGIERVIIHDRVEPNPSLERLDAAIAELRNERIDTIVAVGGGSTIDTGKVLRLALATGRRKTLDLITDGEEEMATMPRRLVAIPTTAGTGSEVTPFATVWDDVARRKLSVGHPVLFPTVAIIDPELAAGLSWEQTLGPGLDAYVQCFEAIWNRNATPITTTFAERGLALVPDALRTLKVSSDSVTARARLAEAAVLSGLAISHTRTALAHSMSYPITAHFGLPHGLACALVMPAVLEFNLEADDGRLAAVSERVGVAPEGLVGSVLDLYRELDVIGATRAFLPSVSLLDPHAAEMLTSERADNNLRPVDVGLVRRILRRTVALFDGEPPA